MKKILIVDDEKNIRLGLTKCLQKEGYDIEEAEDGKDALELISTRKSVSYTHLTLPTNREV